MFFTKLTNLTITHLYQQHHTWLERWLTRKLGCRLDAADLTQDTFVKLLNRSHPELLEPRAYLTRIAHGLMVNHLRRKDIERTYLELLTQQPEAHSPSPEYQALIIETLAELDQLLQGLPTKTRQAFLMSQLEGLKYSDIAQRLSVSVSMVKKYMLQAITHCMKIDRPTE